MTKEDIIKIAEKEIQTRVKEIEESNDSSERYVKHMNEAPCSVCNNKTFIMKFRDVNGYVEGITSGSFGLFGGTISGYVDGKTSTAPLLCCRKCSNERQLIVRNRLYYDGKKFARELGYLSEWTISDKTPDDVSEEFKDLGIEVLCEMEKIIGYDYDYRLCDRDTQHPRFSEKELNKIGLFRKYPEVKGYTKHYSPDSGDMFFLFKLITIAVGVYAVVKIIN